MVPPSAPAEDEAEEETAPVPCVSCDECNHDCCTLCPSVDDNMWSRLSKCLIVQVLIVTIVLLHFALSSQIVSEIKKYEPRSSDQLCSNLACECNRVNGLVYIKCDCLYYMPNISKTFELPFPAVIPKNTTELHISKCDTVKIVKNELRVKDLIFPTWFGIQDVDTLIMDPVVALMGRNIVISNVRYIPEFPIGILRLAVNDWVDSFMLSNITIVDVVRYKAFDAVQLHSKFEMTNITFRVIEESAFNVVVTNGNSGSFIMVGCTIDELKSPSLAVTADFVYVQECHFEHLQSAVFQLHAGSAIFYKNFFSKPVESFAFNISAVETHFYYNLFNELRADAFFGITGRLGLGDSFNFTGNALKIVHNGSLNPNKAVNKDDAVLRNSFLNCTSSNIGWIWEAAYGSYVSTNTKEYYQMLLSQINGNICYNFIQDPESQSCFLDNVTMMYNPQNADNQITKFFNGSVNNDKICNFLINSSIMLEPTVILFVQIVSFYLVAFLIH